MNRSPEELLDAACHSEHLYEEQAAAAEFIAIYGKKLLDIAEAAKDFIDSDGDYFSWTEDERHCMSRLRQTVLALKGNI